MRRAIPVVVLGAAALAVAACGRPRPVASLSVEPTSVNLPHPFVSAMRFRWNPTAELGGVEGKPRVFVHVLDGGRRLLRTFDHPLPEAWAPGRPQDYEVELYQSAIAEPLHAGAYEITVGLYDDAGKKRWPLQADGEEVGRREYRLATLVVPASPPPAPTFEFRGVWLPVEPGSSKQVVARRCLAGEGSIAAVAPPSAGTVRVAASIRSGDASGTTGGPWRVSSSCSPATAEISGIELRWGAFDVAPAEANSSCEIAFTPPLPERETYLHQLCLEVLSWRPAGR
jgi:hypothetical protein